MQKAQDTPTYELLRAQRGKAVQILYERYGRKLYSYALSSWHLDEDTAWDMIYETLYKTVEKIDSYEFNSEKKFGSFLFTIFCNNLRRHYRDNKKREEKLSFSTFNEQNFEASKSDPLMQTERKVQELMVEASMDAFREPDTAGDSLMQILDACLAKLPDWERVLLLLRSQDMPYTEIARYVHKPAEQLKVYHQRAKTKLEKLVEEALTSVGQD
ncbi:MAG: sigma-70 family RNA polymerase sigma factor [Bacteroidetes bacterium]|jgi:RNA polymerase sigma factor (sigma-70 family)|nr:sigma-70 family RNA polymerase sigma factor [Bacteroidota bacterium]MBL0016948.1 sigma-70 family RNA polymerase sigma factor [Bacteroidota bacterium]MBP6639978.1 sigma-70 family RNA polymerase sigma factor [Bacteroidia bacterium]MBP6721160.1 sigma-70 family RNA polymerase sigma factor [Bacteroidia bacterium]